MSNLKEDAEFLRHVLLAGHGTTDEVIAWADRVIVEQPNPELAIIEIALAGPDPNSLASLLRGVPGVANPDRVRRRLLARLLQVLEADPAKGEEIAYALYRLATAGELPEEHFGTDPYCLADAFELVRGGVLGDESAALAELRSYLERYSRAGAWGGH